MDPVYQLSVLVISLDRLLRVCCHALVAVLTRVCGHLVGQGVTPPVVVGYFAAVLVLLRLVSWNPLHLYGVNPPGYDDSPRTTTSLHQTCWSIVLACGSRH